MSLWYRPLYMLYRQCMTLYKTLYCITAQCLYYFSLYFWQLLNMLSGNGNFMQVGNRECKIYNLCSTCTHYILTVVKNVKWKCKFYVNWTSWVPNIKFGYLPTLPYLTLYLALLLVFDIYIDMTYDLLLDISGYHPE